MMCSRLPVRVCSRANSTMQRPSSYVVDSNFICLIVTLGQLIIVDVSTVCWFQVSIYSDYDGCYQSLT